VKKWDDGGVHEVSPIPWQYIARRNGRHYPRCTIGVEMPDSPVNLRFCYSLNLDAIVYHTIFENLLIVWNQQTNILYRICTAPEAAVALHSYIRTNLFFPYILFLGKFDP
jgi:hypothetical protein